MDELAALTRGLDGADDGKDRGRSADGHDTDDERDGSRGNNNDDNGGRGGKLRQGGVSIAPAPPLSSARVAAPPPLVEHSGRRTGPKGVRDDARAATAAAREAQREAVARTRKEQERRALVAPSYAEEEAARARLDALQLDAGGTVTKPLPSGAKGTRDNDGSGGDSDADADTDSELRARRIAALTRASVREVSGTAYLSSIEKPGWVLAAIYEPDMDRCDALLTQLATAGVPAVRARASRIGFSLLDDVTARLDAPDEDEREARADPDVLPTLLAYRSGNLVHNWVRVDLEPVYATDGLRGLLESEGIVSP